MTVKDRNVVLPGHKIQCVEHSCRNTGYAILTFLSMHAAFTKADMREARSYAVRVTWAASSLFCKIH